MEKTILLVVGTRRKPIRKVVALPGYEPSARITPNMARVALRSAGYEVGEAYDYRGGYRVYANTARKLNAHATFKADVTRGLENRVAVEEIAGYRARTFDEVVAKDGDNVA